MYESYYRLAVKPFQLRPDPRFFFKSRSHKRAMAYLEYGIAQGEGFIVITGEVGAGKTTLVRHLFRDLDATTIAAAQIVNTHLSSEDTLRMVATAFGVAVETETKAGVLMQIEQFLRACNAQGKRALLIVDEAQNLSPQTIEELRMLSNFQTNDHSLLQTFLLGQPEFRSTLMSTSMHQLRQRVIATYHLGPMDLQETRQYIEHRLETAGWQGDPSLSEPAFDAIHNFTGGIPRKINSFCDRLFLMGYLEELHHFDNTHVALVARDIDEEFVLPQAHDDLSRLPLLDAAPGQSMAAASCLDSIDARLTKIEHTQQSMVNALAKLLELNKTHAPEREPNP